MRRSKIAGLGSFVPEWVVTNEDMRQWMDTSDEWIQARTGIKERRWVRPGSMTGSSDLGVEAGKRALAAAGIEAKDIQLLIFATLSPDHVFPGTGMFASRKLGVPAGAAVLDVRQQCTGFIYALSIADQFIKTEMYDRILIIGAEVHSTALDLSTRGRDVTVIFGDGAGAAVITPGDDTSHILSTHLHADGTHAEDLWVDYPSCLEHPQLEAGKLTAESTRHFPKMKGKPVFKHACTRMPEAIFEALVRNGKNITDLKMLVPHQANMRINQFVAQLMTIPEEKVFHNIQRYGNTTAASIPLALDECQREGKVNKGDLVCLAAFGAGFTWGSALLHL